MTADNPTPVPLLRFPEFRDAGHWEPSRFGRIGEIVGGGTPDTSVPEYWGGDIQWFTPTEIKDRNPPKSKRTITSEGLNNSSAKLLPVGTLLITTRASIGDVGIAESPCATNQGFQSLVVGENEVNTFWYYWLAQHSSELKDRASGSTFLEIGKSELKKIPVLRTDEKEQRKIAECLGSLDDLIAAEGRELEALRQHKQGLMQQLFPKPGETVPRLRFPEFLNGATWDELTIGDVCDLKAGDFISASEIAEHADEGSFPCYGGNGFRGYVKSFTHEGRYVLVGRQGALCGNVNLYAGKFHATEHALVATPKPGVDTGWLFYILDVLKLNRFSTGQAQPGLSVGVLRDVDISVPIGEDEQQKIADCFGSLDDLIAAEGRKLEGLRQHKQGLMQQVFPLAEGTLSCEPHPRRSVGTKI